MNFSPKVIFSEKWAFPIIMQGQKMTFIHWNSKLNNLNSTKYQLYVEQINHCPQYWLTGCYGQHSKRRKMRKIKNFQKISKNICNWRLFNILCYIFCGKHSHDLSVDLICQISENSYWNMIVAVNTVTQILIGERKYATFLQTLLFYKANLFILMYNQVWNVTTH